MRHKLFTLAAGLVLAGACYKTEEWECAAAAFARAAILDPKDPLMAEYAEKAKKRLKK